MSRELRIFKSILPKLSYCVTKTALSPPQPICGQNLIRWSSLPFNFKFLQPKPAAKSRATDLVRTSFNCYSTSASLLKNCTSKFPLSENRSTERDQTLSAATKYCYKPIKNFSILPLYAQK